MKILLPPSETKRIGGTGAPWSAAALAMPSLQPQRDRVVDALIALAADPEAASRVLKLSARQRGEITHNAALREAATMPAVDRYTGVLFDALDASTLAAAARRWLGQHVWIHSAPFGPVGALDPIPAYRLGAAVSLPGVPPLRRVWADAVSESIAASHPRFILDLRSEAYVALGPIPDSVASAYVRVVTDEEGSTRALNHFNKHAKGALVRRLAEDRPRIDSVTALFAWADHSDVTLRPTGTARTIELVVPA
ncbi:YaaA family protein [Microbacterium keratanolyticum]|uniref:YaaA family protein n=1 Tax=Microbacterium keratanolyticum TaxID=67574 RepID=UPI0036391775